MPVASHNLMKNPIPSFSRSRRLVFGACLVLLVTLAAALVLIRPSNAGSSAPAEAAIRYDSSKGLSPAALTIIVNTLGDAPDTNAPANADGICDTDAATPGDQCTLRAAIQETNAVSSDDTINFSLPANSAITLNTALPAFSGNIAIVGPGASLLTIQRSTAAGTPNFRFFTFVPINGNFNNSISGLTLVNGLAPTGSGFSSDQGGAVYNSNNCTLTITDVVIRGNNALSGGGIFNAGPLTLTNSTVDGNNATTGAGGGIFNSGGALSLVRTTISGNTTVSQGGGIYNSGGFNPTGTATLTNSTVSGNTATGALSNGVGGIYNASGGHILTLTNTTVLLNTASGTGSGVAGIFNSSGSTANLGNSIVAKNTSASMAQDLNGTFTSQGYNLIGESTGNGLTNGSNGDQVGTAGSPIDPLLGPLADNGGPTKTHALMVGSPAIDAGNSSQTTDQRNQPRPIDDPNVTNAAGGNAKDIGAYEAHTYQVNSIADNTDGACTAPGSGNGCTLREAIAAANTDTGAELITFAPALTAGGPATLTLLTALPSVATDLIISGPGSNQLNVQRSLAGGTPEFRIFTINQGVTVEISGLTISNGKLVNPPGGGGGISNSGTLNLHHSAVSGNSSGIYNLGTLTVSNALVSANTGTGISSGVFGGTTNATISNSLISNNSNGGIFNNASNGGSATLSINATTISGNSAQLLGGGVFNGAASSTSRAALTIENSTISGNSAPNSGGGLYNAAVFGAVTTATVSNTTISGNTQGGGIFHMSNGSGSSSSLVLNDCTISNNYIGGASLSTGGIHSISEPGPTVHVLRLRNSIVAQNFTAPGGPSSDITGPVDAASSFNLIGLGGSGGLTDGVNNNQVLVASPLLGPLANNGGPTQTHALLPGSPAINAGSNANLSADTLDRDGDGNITESIPFDQRGFARVTNTTVDIGAFESRGFTIAATGGTRQSATINTDFGSLLAATVSSPFGEPVVGGFVTFTAPVSGASGTFAHFGRTYIAVADVNGVATTLTFTANGAPGDYNVGATIGSGLPTASFALTNLKINQTITFGVLTDRTFGDPDFNLTATASSQLAVTFTPSGNCTIVSGNNVHLGSVGSCTITASQGGDASYNAAPDVARTFNIQQADQTITFTSLPNKTFGDPDFTVSAMASSNLSVNFSALGACTVSNGTVHITGAGSCTITASQPGNENFKSAPAAQQAFNIADVISINDVSTTEGDSGTKTLNFTVMLAAASNQTVTVSYATANGSASAPADYVPISATTLTFNPGDTAKTIGVIINGDQSFEPDETLFVDLTIPTNATISDNQGMGTILNDDAQGGIISFSQSNYSVDESAGSLVVTVKRTGDTSSAAGVDYGTSDGGASSVPCSSTSGLASARCDFTTSMGTLNFAAGEGQKSFTVLVNGDSYSEGPESFSVNLSNQTGGAILSTPSTAIITIADDSSGLPPNAIDAAQFFVRQQYHDFLNREPDASGLNFWTNQITSCGTDRACIELKRINVSAAFFLSIEFQDTGYLVERIYKAAYGDVNGTSTFGGAHQLTVPAIRFNEFLPDTQEIGQGVIVGQGNWQQQLDNNKVAFTAEFVRRPRFITAFPNTMPAEQFVDTLNMNAGNPLSQPERDKLVSDLLTNATTRAQVLRAVAEDPDLKSAEFNRAFVLMQFFGYLRRNPNDVPDSNYTGYDFWLTKLNQFNGNFQNAEMVKAFINSSEYRQRFGP
jgi:CSLREA domain-containing protein